MSRVNIEPWYFSLYASMKRSGLAGNGYPKQVPWYTPPRWGETSDSDREVITDDDWAIATDIESAVNAIRQRGKRQRVLADCLDIWEGAYTDAPPSRKDRCKANSVNYEACKKSAQRCKKEVERLLYRQ